MLSTQQRKAFRDIGACRTAALGSYVEQCDHCFHQAIEYRSCRNRHCPKCHSRAREEWLAPQAEEILPVPFLACILLQGNDILVIRLSPARRKEDSTTRFYADFGR